MSDEPKDLSKDLPEDDSIFENLSNMEDSVQSDALLEVSHNDSLEELTMVPGHTSTPISKKRKTSMTTAVPVSRASTSRQRMTRANTAASGPSAQSQLNEMPATMQKTARLKCPKCPSTLANKRTLDTHLRGHVMTGVTSRIPSMPELQKDIGPLFQSVLGEYVKSSTVGELGEGVKTCCETLLQRLADAPEILEDFYVFVSQSFDKFLRQKKLLFPNAIKNNIYVGTNKLLASADFRKKVKDELSPFVEVDVSVLNVFAGNVIFDLSKKVLVYCTQKMRCSPGEEIEKRIMRGNDRIESRTFQELVYHIGGSIVAGFTWKGKKYSKTSKQWATFVDILKNNFKRDDNKLNECAPSVRGFSEAKDRGGYTHICGAAFDFFLMLFDLLMQLEGEDGSLPHSVIDEKVLTDDAVLLLWDNLVGDDLTEEESLDFLIQVIGACIKVVMKGIMLRRLNDHLKKSYASIPLRSRLAR